MKVAVCLYVKNEERSVAEWVAFHRAVGFDSFLIYDNLSDDGTPGQLERLSRHADVRTVLWSATDPDSQRSAYQHAVTRARGEFDWVLFIDSDEFFLPLAHDTVQAYLASVGEARAVALNWAIFGSSGHLDYPEGLVIESFTGRAPDDFPAHRHVKSFVRPEAVVQIQCAHVAEVEGGYVDPEGRPAQWVSSVRTTPQIGVCRINHYFTRSRAHWRDKIARGYRHMARPDEHFEQYNRNEVVDETALRFAPAVRALMEAWAA